MLKTLLLSSVMGVMLTGCIVSPYDDHTRGQYQHKYDSKTSGEGRYKNAHKRDWNNSDRRYKNQKNEHRR